MQRDPTGGSHPPASPLVLARWPHAHVVLALQQRRLRVVDAPMATILVSTHDDTAEIARAAWQILAASGGLVDRSDIRRRWNMNRSRVHELTGQRFFPDPVGEIGGRPVWLAVDVDAYRAHPPPPGRPPRAEGD